MNSIRQYLSLKQTYFKNRFLNKSLITVFLGNFGVSISVFKNHKLLKSIFIPTTEKEASLYQELLLEFPGYQVAILIAHNNIKCQHESLIALNSYLKKNPINNFIETNFDESTLVAYNVLSITNLEGETWNSQLVSIPLIPNVKSIIDITVSTPNVKFQGVYMLPLEVPILSKYLIKDTEISSEVLTLVGVVTKANGIILCLFQGKDILYYRSMPYDNTKSMEYTYGVLSHETDEVLLLFKSHIEKFKTKVVAHYLVNEEIAVFVKNNAKPYSVHVVDVPKLFADDLISEAWSNQQRYPASNLALQKLTKIVAFNFRFFKPIALIMLFFLYNLISHYSQIKTIQKQINVQSGKLENLSFTYEQLVQEFGNVEYLPTILETYSITNFSNQRLHTPPFKLIKFLLQNSDDSVKIKNLKWQALTTKLENSINQGRLEFSFDYIKSNLPDKDFLAQVEQYHQFVNSLFQNYQVEYLYDKNNMSHHADTTKLSVGLTIVGPVK